MASHDRDTAAVSVRRLLWILPLSLLILLVVAWFWLLHTESGARWVWSQAASATGQSLRAASVGGALSTDFVARDVVFENDAVRIDVSRATMSVNVDLFPARVTVRPTTLSGLRIALVSGASVDDGANAEDAPPDLILPIEVIFEDIKLEDGVLVNPEGDATLQINSITLAGRWKDEIELDRFDAELAARPELTGLGADVAGTASLQGTLNDLVFAVATQSPRARLTGRVSHITTDITWEAKLEVPDFALPADPDAPEMPPLRLSAEGRGDLETFTSRAHVTVPGTGTQVRFAASVDIGAETLSGDVDWQNAQWPVGGDEPRLRSQAGELTLSGSLDSWQASGSIELDVAGLPPGALTLAGNGNREDALIEILDSDVLGGAVAGRLEYSSAETQPFSARLELDNIDTGALFPEHPAVLSGKLDVDGQLQPLQLSIRLDDVAGRYAGSPLRATGTVHFADERLSVDTLSVRHGETTALISGDPYAVNGLTYEVYIDALDRYLEGSFGTLAANGVLSLRPDGQFLRIDASSPELGWRDIRVAGFNITDSGDGILDAVLTADAIKVGSAVAGPLRLHPQLDRDFQRVDIDVESGALQLSMSLEGLLDNWQRPTSWSGDLTGLNIEHEDFAAILDAPAPMTLSRQGASVEQLCIVTTAGDKSCSFAEWDSRGGLDLTASVDSIPIDLVNRFIATSSHFDQHASGELTLSTTASGALTGRGEIHVSPGRISSADDVELFIATGPSKFGFDVVDDSLRSGLLEIPFTGLGRISARLEVLDLAADAPANIDGQVEIDLEDIGSLLALFPVLDSADGRLSADFRIAGTVADPLLGGTVGLSNGALSYEPLGLELEDINLDSRLEENGEIELTGSFRAGEGRAEIRTRADNALTTATGLELTLQGENLTVIDVPDLRALADIDLSLGYDGQRLNLNGNVTIPHARVRPANLGTTRVYESEDVVIVAGELPEEPISQASAPDIELFGSVQVALGNDVVADLEVTRLAATGSAAFTWQGELIPTALGRYNVGGQILVFGQLLEISEGVVRYDDVPATEPYVRIRAERDIFGNTQVRRAGVLVAGLATRPTIEPYTLPRTTKERALTLLVTGSDFDLEQGVGAIGFGTYIAPRVFLSYGIGLFDNENVVRVRYDITRGFGVTATSGQKESGVDLNYRFEN